MSILFEAELAYSHSKEVEKLKFLQTNVIGGVLETSVSLTTIYSSICLNEKKKCQKRIFSLEK